MSKVDSKLKQEGASYQYERELLRVSKKELSELTGYSQSTITRFERGEAISERDTFKREYLVELYTIAYDSYTALRKKIDELPPLKRSSIFTKERSD